MTSWLLIVWMCAGPGQCHWQIAGELHSEESCIEQAVKLNRYAECIKMTVPAPGNPR